MAIDSAGAQHRQSFFTDSSAIYCIADFSSARADASLDFVFRQTGVFPWCAALTDSRLDTMPLDRYNVFALGEQTPGVGTETVVAEELLPNGTPTAVTCNGYIAPNLPSGNICGTSSSGSACGTGTSPCTGEGISYASEGANSAGPGFTCCATLVTGETMTAAAPSVIPYPAGEYTCTVSLDGNVAGVTTFYIEYPSFPNSSCPAAQINGVNCFCPSPPPVDGIPCYNWVPKGAVCPSNTPTINCTCNDCGVWSCPG
jgi:hypothetical protein